MKAEEYWRVFVPLLRGDGATFLERLAACGGAPASLPAFLSDQRLAATVAGRIEHLRLATELPAELAQGLRDQRKSQFLLALKNLRHARYLGDCLSGLDVEHLFLKGPLLAQEVWGSIESRSVGDIDLLVRPRDVDRVEAALLEGGYDRAYGIYGGRRLSRFFTHHFAFRGDGHMVEIHWRLLREAGVREDLGSLWASVRSVEHLGCHYPAPGLDWSLAILNLSLIKDLELGLPSLRTIADIWKTVLQLEPELDWPLFLERMHRQGAGAMAVAALELMIRLMECRGDFPRLEAALRARQQWVKRLDANQPTLGIDIFEVCAPAWANKRKLFPLHRGGPVPAWSWWAVSFRFRQAVYKSSL